MEWVGTEPLQILTIDGSGFAYEGVSTPLHRFALVEVSVNARESDADFRRRPCDLALDCVNQGGISNLYIIESPA